MPNIELYHPVYSTITCICRPSLSLMIIGMSISLSLFPIVFRFSRSLLYLLLILCGHKGSDPSFSIKIPKFSKSYDVPKKTLISFFSCQVFSRYQNNHIFMRFCRIAFGKRIFATLCSYIYSYVSICPCHGSFF